MESQEDRKKFVRDFFRLVAEGKPREGLRFFAPDCKQHNPYIQGGMDSLLESMASVQQEEGPKYPEADFSIKRILADGDMVAVHTEILSSKSDPAKGGLRQVHLFRFDDRNNKIVEYWDITKVIEPDMPNPKSAF
jgi:predicted SnoaL-like aldol condensation-catalyzing enzyme